MENTRNANVTKNVLVTTTLQFVMNLGRTDERVNGQLCDVWILRFLPPRREWSNLRSRCSRSRSTVGVFTWLR